MMARASALAMPSSISMSTWPLTPREAATSSDHARSNRLWLAIPIRTASAFSGRTAASTRRFHEASTSALDP